MVFASAIAVYFIIWWLTLFMVLPIGARSQQDAGEVFPGSEAGAPVKPRIMWLLGLTTLLAGVFFSMFWLVYVLNIFDLQMISDIKR